MAKLHEYPVTVNWEGGREGKGAVTDEKAHLTTALATPPEFGGSGAGTNPEQLLAMSVASCYTITFGIIAANRKLPVSGIKTEATGEVEENGPSFTYKKVTIRPQITLAGADDTQLKLAEEMAHKADSYCIITNAIRDKVTIVVEPTILNH